MLQKLRSCGRGGALACALVALLSAAAAAADSAPDSRPAAACQQLHRLYERDKAGVDRATRVVSVQGRARTLTVYWDGRAPSRAAAALLAAALRHQLRYRAVRLARVPARRTDRLPDFCDLAQLAQENCHLLENLNTTYDNVIVGPALAWSGARCLPQEYCMGDARTVRVDRWVAAPRLAAEARGAAPAALTLLVHLTAAASVLPVCAHAHSWNFYASSTNLNTCGFKNHDITKTSAPVYIFLNESKVVEELKQRINASSLHLEVIFLEPDTQPRDNFLRLLRERKSSFLIFDYDLWSTMDGVKRVSVPPPTNASLSSSLDSMRSLRVADDLALRQTALPVLETLQHFWPSPVDLREILVLELNHRNIEDAACAWALNNTSKFNSYHTESKHVHWIAVFLCANDPDKDKYIEVAKIVKNIYLRESKQNVNHYFVDINCEKDQDLNDEYIKTFLSYKWQKLIGVVAAGLGKEMAAENADGLETALVFYDLPGPRVRLGARARAVSGNVYQLAVAIQHFILQFKWKRLAMISEDTTLAAGLRDALNKGKLAIYDTPLTNDSSSAIKELLEILLKKTARIIFINTNANIAEMILCEAYNLGMTAWTEYVWIVRERRALQLKCFNDTVRVDHFTISFWWRGGRMVSGRCAAGIGAAVREQLSELWGEASWPPLAASLADSLQVLMQSFKEFSKRYPEKFFDLHGFGTTELFLNGLNNEEVNGVIQTLRYTNGTLDEPLVFVDLWRNNRHEPLFHWRIKHDQNVETVRKVEYDIFNGTTPTDGSKYCVTPTTGDPFLPRCHDLTWFITLGCIAAVILALFLARRIRLHKLARRDALLKAQLLAKREFVATALVEHYVDRGALELYHDLGHGCFGRVRYGILRAPERPPVSVAVKEAHDDASPSEESELLREACTIATLRHDHIVRLIGVCATDKPLLVLMEYAFFGDLRDYLSERRHLAERAQQVEVDENDETYHISAVSLTRLAKEAASALEYLSQESIVHRDVRASNCLVDARRSLKLADFGMARETGTGLGGEAEYSCQRRGLFPVLWMAPESLERGVFTAASDAWALGVLLLELVTLGARPYGAWPPLRVLRYVCNGGRPPLPPDASPHTRRILAQCWRSMPEERATAGALEAQLRESPAALQPALQPVPAPADEDCPTIDPPLDQVTDPLLDRAIDRSLESTIDPALDFAQDLRPNELG